MDRLARSFSKIISKSAFPDRSISLEGVSLAKSANGACLCSLGDTNVLTTTVAEIDPKPPTGFAPITIDFKLKAAAAGRIPTSHLRRDVGFTEKEILTSRMIDRALRPAFGKGFLRPTQIVCNPLSVDGHNDPDVLAINGASASIAVSDIPWNGPIGAVRVGLVENKLVANPTRREQEISKFNIVIAANDLGNVTMLDGTCREPIHLDEFAKAIKVGMKECIHITEAIKQLEKDCGRPKRAPDFSFEPTEEQLNYIKENSQEKIVEVLSNHDLDKASRDEELAKIRNPLLDQFIEKFKNVEAKSQFLVGFVQIIRSTYHNLVRETGYRCDGRKIDQLRPISCSIDLYKPLHGSALFQRGQTQVLCSTTFDSPDAAIKNDMLTLLTSGVKEKNFMLHYEFPPYATNEIGKVGWRPGRREIGHGALAEKALRPLVPDNNDMTTRLNCEVLESNGSSSMASVCAGSLSLMDASVSIPEHVAGISIGLISGSKDAEEILLTDISGFEDFFGDMDFKIAGTKKAVTAFQLDVKPIDGIPTKYIHKALRTAQIARGQVITIMNNSIKQSRTKKKDNHPVLKTIYIPAHKKAKFVGVGGSNLRKLTSHIGVKVTLLEDEGANPSENQGNCLIFAPNQEALLEAEEYIKNNLEKDSREPELEFNAVYSARIEEIRPDGVLVTLYPNMNPTLLHVSQLDIRPISHPSALNLTVGQEIQVKYFGRDPTTGRMRISRKSLLMSAISRTHPSSF